MRRLRFYCERVETHCSLDEEQAHHLSKVLRITPGTPVEVFDGRGTLGFGKVDRVERRQATLVIERIKHLPPASSGRLILAISYAKGQRFDWLVEKCTELGADHIMALQFDRTVKLGGEHAIERLRRISLSACKQCGRLFLPVVSGPDRLEPSIKSLLLQYPQAALYCGDPAGKPPAEIERTRDTIVLIGPEGGLSPAESEWVAETRFEPVCINPNILRVETAAIAFCAFFGAFLNKS